MVYWDKSITHIIDNQSQIVGFRDADEIAKMNVEAGVNIAFDLNSLIEKAYHVHPAAERWFLDLVSEVSKKYGMTWNVERSNLTEGPLR